MSKLKLFQATLETVPNNCYVETVLITAEDEKQAHELLVEKNGRWGVTYTQPLKEIKINMKKPTVLRVGHGHGEDNYGYDD